MIYNMKNTRTLNSLRNSVVALFMYIVNFVLQFISRKVFIDHLGADVLGLNTTITSILQFLNCRTWNRNSSRLYIIQTTTRKQ